MIRYFMALLLAIMMIGSGLLTPMVTNAAAADYDIPGGHFYTQAAGPQAVMGTGFAILDLGLDDRGQIINFWSEFKRLGGVSALGYPASNRFILDGFVTQATQRVLMQWRPEVHQVYFVNVFDKLHDLGLDSQLQTKYQVPPPVNVNDVGKPFSQVVAERQAYLNANPAIKQKYFSMSDPLQLNGLPTSQVTDAGGVFDIIRSQRIVIQYWKKSLPGIANAGDVTVGLGGDIAKEFGLVPTYAQTPLTDVESMLLSLALRLPVKGSIIFGDNYRETQDGFEIINPRNSFKAGETIRYSAHLNEPAGTTTLKRTIAYISLNGSEQLVSSEDHNLSDSQADLLAGGVTTLPSLKAGIYIFRFIRGGTVLAEGVFGIEGTAPATSTPPPQQPPSSNVIPIGTKVRAGGWEYTVTDVKANRAVYDGSGDSRVAKGFYVIVFLTVTNVGTGTDYFATAQPILLDGQDRAYSHDTSAELDAKYQYGKDWDLVDTNPGVTRQIVVVFDVAMDASNFYFGTTNPVSGPVQLGSPHPPQ